MKVFLIRVSLSLLVPLVLFSIVSRRAQAQEHSTPLSVIQAVEEKLRGETVQGRYEITIERSRYNRTMVIDSWDDVKNDSAFIRIVAPKKDAGTTFLKIKNNLWQYIPSIGKEIKIEGSLMQDSWMGSDLSNDDLVNSTSIVDDYEHKFITGSSSENYRIEMKPKPTAAIVWNRVVYEVRKNDLMPMRVEFYDHKDRLSRVILYDDFRSVSGKTIPMKLTVQSIKNDRVTSSTIMKYLRVVFDRPIPASVFSRANLRR